MTRTLDPAHLDGIVAELELAELATLERVMFAVRLMLNDFESWLRRLANDEDSWLNRLADLIGAANGSGSTFSLLDVMFVAVPAVIATIALCAAAIYLWRRRRGEAPPPVEFPGLHGTASTAADDAPIASLPAREQPAALFHYVCKELASDGVIRFEKNQTNSTIARAAQLTGGPRESLSRLARAADRAVFGGWRPDEPDLQELRRRTRELLGEQRRPS